MTYTKRGSVTWKGFFVHWKDDEYGYFVHGLDYSRAKAQVLRRMKYKRSIQGLLCCRAYFMDDKPIAYEDVFAQGYSLKNPDIKHKGVPVCECALCRGKYDPIQAK